MRFPVPLMLISAAASALAACNRAPSDQGEINIATNDAIAVNGSAATTVAAPAIGFVGGDGGSLGTVTLEDSASGLVLRLAGTGMPAGAHGLHFHTAGLCDGPKFESAGAHWNPDNKKHGTQNPEGPHKGDLPNVTVAADGTLSQNLTAPGVTLAELQDADGTALVVHARPDDNRTDPSGDSGDRIACAIVAAAP